MCKLFGRHIILLIILLPLLMSCSGGEEVEYVSEVPADEAPAQPEPEPPSEEWIHELIHEANGQYEMALEMVNIEELVTTWHGPARQRWQDRVDQLQDAGRYRISTGQIEVVTAYQQDEENAIAKTIEFWDYEERDVDTDEVSREGSLGPLFETYHIEKVDGRWSIGRFSIFEEPTLTLTEIEGDVRVNDMPVIDDREIQPGDEIAVNFDSFALLLYPFDSESEIRADSHLALTSLSVDPDSSQLEPRVFAEFDIFGSEIWNILNKKLKSFVKVIFRSPSGAEIDDDPSEFGVILQDDGKFIVQVVEGEVTLTSEGQSVVVMSGEQSSALPGSPPIEPVPYPGEPPLDTTSTPGLPDLVVTKMFVTESVFEIRDTNFLVPVVLTIENQGDEPADIFKIAAFFTDEDGTFLAPFSVTEEFDSSYYFTEEPLEPGDVITLEGFVLVPTRLDGQTVDLSAFADSCAGEEFMPEYCRIEESNEDNNAYEFLPVELPVIVY